MKRRRFLGIVGMLAIGEAITGCGQSRGSSDNSQLNQSLPPFSSDRLHQLLEELRLAFEAKGLNVSRTLLPPLKELELREKCDWFPGEIVPELSALYSWRGGQQPGPWGLAVPDHPFWFRDYAFSSLAIAKDEYQSMMASYGQIPKFHEQLKTCFPFAAFNGGWLVIPTMPHLFDKELARPIVSVLEGIDVLFYSIEKMVETCIDWVSHPAYLRDGTLPENVEHEIWRKHNPGIF